ncbi:MAG: exo-alpha-sialidase [Taibaiella sp.]|nr:exo-alpha-sialidase [Taibaiella sp.]
MKLLFTSLLIISLSVQAISQTITWGTPVIVNPGSTYGNLHPRVTLNRSGNPMVLWGKTDTRAYFSRWNGTAFTTPLAVGNTGINVFAQSWAGPDIASYGDTVYVTMKRTPENTSMNHMYMSHSYDGGITFSDTVKIDNIGANMSRFPIVTTTSTGNPLVAFMKFSPTFTTAKYVVSRSTDYGMTFSPEVAASATTDSVCDCCPASLVSSGNNVIMLNRENI